MNQLFVTCQAAGAQKKVTMIFDEVTLLLQPCFFRIRVFSRSSSLFSNNAEGFLLYWRAKNRQIFAALRTIKTALRR